MRPGATQDGRATLATVAAAAGVSVATVSKVLNGRSDVAPATRGLVQDLLVEYDYVGRGADTVRRAVPTTRPTVELVYAGVLNAYSTSRSWTSPRVAGATSLRPLSTLETVATETPAAAATVARVARPSLVVSGLTAPLRRPAAR